MTPLQTQLLTSLGLPLWQCTHPERLPYAPQPVAAPAQLLLVVGEGERLPEQLLADLLRALMLEPGQVQQLSERDWRKAGCPVAPATLGFNLEDSGDLTWSGALPLTVEHKRRLWSCLCSLTIDR
ncbi:DNA polymerase III subunit psi [Zobellella maritima]|uniref:DNA polymerase III subunit psi n=1 Tax=Zobellella maritima TaxID=2059725 RepID=UPI000E30112B|nr:DNA polymerase III subunit psi [Zobellella maritima]